MKKGKAASHHIQNFTDSETIGLVQAIISSHKRVLPKLACIDKWPNIDGTLDVQNEEFELLGTLFTQVKKLTNTTKLSVRCPSSFVEYCKLDRLKPVIFLGVNSKEKLIYWEAIRPDNINNFKKIKDSEYYNFVFDEKKVIDENNDSYISE